MSYVRRSITVGSLCSGYEGLGLGLAQVLDTELAWVSEVDPSACAILDARYPGVPNLGDLTALDWKEIAHMGAHRNDEKAQAMFDKTHNEVSNFECMPKDEHARLYGTGCNQAVHRCKREVMPSDSPAVDVLTAGYP